MRLLGSLLPAVLVAAQAQLLTAATRVMAQCLLIRGRADDRCCTGSLSRPVFQRRPSTYYMCAQEIHTYNRIETSKQCLYKAEYILY
jgi:hypothetical protein